MTTATSTQPSTGMIPHAAGCRRPTPTLRLSWKGQPEAHCPGCGRSVALPIPEKETTP